MLEKLKLKKRSPSNIMVKWFKEILLWVLMFFRFLLFLIIVTIGGVLYHSGKFLIDSGKKLMKCTEDMFE